MPEPELLHLYSQRYFHTPAFIIGNRAGLELLLGAITAALEAGGGCAEVFASDGEGYGVLVKLEDTPWLEPEDRVAWSRLDPPYSDEEACGPPRPGSWWPVETATNTVEYRVVEGTVPWPAAPRATPRHRRDAASAP